MDVFPSFTLVNCLDHDFRLAANTMESLQGRSSGSSWRNSGESDRILDGSGRKSLGSGRRKDTKLRSKGVMLKTIL